MTLDEVKESVDILFLDAEHRDSAFNIRPFTDELQRALEYVNQGGSLDREYLNRILIACHLGPVDQTIFDLYFPRGINSAEKLKEGVAKFAEDALLHFGSFHQAFFRIKADANLLPAVKQPFGSETRAPFTLSSPLQIKELAYLGYVSGGLPTQMSDAHQTIMRAMGALGSRLATEENIRHSATEIGIDIEKTLKTVNAGLEKRGQKQVTIEDYVTTAEEIRLKIETFIEEVRRCRQKGIRNQEQYINSAAEMDVYVATSMRDERDYHEMHGFIRTVFERHDIARLNLRYFDPTQAYCPNKYDKGLVECLMIRCAKVTIYCAQLQDTMGKDSELAITLGLGKPVIVFVPRGNTPEDRVAYDKRARIFADIHPLSLQVDQRTGNSNGIMLVRDANECANVLYAIAKNQLRVEVMRECEQDSLSGETTTNWVLRENMTPNHSVIRVATGWKHLRTAFWSAFRPDLHIP
ncbi:hypothetical protein [Enhygromyxa salina]|uniref:hypothetical protein n=1 Tax=Enhygromyxa salina TaxID=215803 RepID=UPI0011B239D5|nr:hypothetical protein [Enhygromyxa salina]